MDAEVKYGDKRPIDLYTNLDLTGNSSIVVHAKPLGGGAAVVLAHSIIGAPTEGHLQHVLTGTLAEGTYYVEITVEFNGGTTRVTVPNDGFSTLEVGPALG